MSDRVLKARQVSRGQIAFNFEDLQRQGDEYLQKVQEQAHGLIEQARQQGEALRQEAYALGYADGQKTGLADAQKQIETQGNQLAERKTAERLRSALPALEAAVSALRAERDKWLNAWESAALGLSVAIAERILHCELERRPEIVGDLITETLQLAAGSPRFTLRMNPADIEQLEASGHAVLQQLATIGEATVAPDPRVTRGGCIIETSHGVIDAQLETQLERIREELG